MFANLPKDYSDPKEFAKRLYADLVARFWAGEFDHLTPAQFRQQVHDALPPQFYDEYLKLVHSSGDSE